MSVQAVAWAIQQKAGGPTEKAVLMALANYADADGECWPSYQTIADDCEISKRTAMRVIDRLEEMGLVEKRNKTRANGGDTTNIYRLRGCQNVTGGGDTGDTGGVTLVSPHMNRQSNRKASKKPTGGADDLCEAVWAAQPEIEGRRRSTRPDVAEALKAVLKRGHDPDDVLAAVRAYYALPASRKDGGQYASGAKVILSKDRWMDFRPKPPPTVTLDPAYRQHLEDRFHRTGEWNDAHGPKPERRAA